MFNLSEQTICGYVYPKRLSLERTISLVKSYLTVLKCQNTKSYRFSIFYIFEIFEIYIANIVDICRNLEYYIIKIGNMGEKYEK